ncbi:MAG: tetratricopeptide repeat protein [Bacteriovoracaceae bacterium]|nr:tetratricopeptide repeat protein [Bacteriovoracaceae bacterium]
MKKKYRVKLSSGRIVGPFNAGQIGELYEKGHITGSEDCQMFPGGDWNKVKDFKVITDAIKLIISKKKQAEDLQDKTTVDTLARVNLAKKLKSIKSEEEENPSEKLEEFKFSKEGNADVKVNYDELEKNYEKKQEEVETEPAPEPEEEEEEDEGVEKTVVLRRPVTSGEDDLDKTVVTRLPDPEPEPEPEPEEVEEPEEEEELEENVDYNEATVVANLNELLPSVKNESLIAEKEFQRKIIEEKEKISIPKREKKKKKEKGDGEEKKKPMKPIVAFAFLVIIWFLYTDEEKVKPVPQRITISFPVTFEVMDEVKSRESLAMGVETYSKGGYLNTVKAAILFKNSLSYQFRGNKALGWLILTYAEIFRNAKDKIKAANTLFKLLKIGRTRILKDINVAMGAARFYSEYKKYQTSINVIENFIRVGKPTVKLMALYMDVLRESGDLVKSRKVYDKLKDLPKKTIEVYLSLARFLELDERKDESYSLIQEGLKKFPNSVPMLLKFSDYQLEKGDYRKYKILLQRVEELGSEGSPIYYAKFLENMGMMSAINKNNVKAAELFNLALKIEESDVLRSKLAALSLGGDSSVENLILQSKVIELMKKARLSAQRKEWEKAFKTAIEAADLGPAYIPAQLLLSEIQVMRGYFESAISTLEKLRTENPLNVGINFKLIMAYIDSMKLADANKLINVVSQTKFRASYQYASVLGRYYNKRNNPVLTVKWLKESIKRYPLNDRDYFILAKVYLKNRKYDRAKQMLSESISLDPRNVDYRLTYARILYERSDIDAALGYLRDVLSENKDHPQILGEMAIYYYKSGQMKQFEEYKKRVENLVKKDQSFYEFLIKAAKLDERYKDVIKYARMLIKVNPGDLETRMTLGEYLFREKQYRSAIEIFLSITERLKSFPKTHYYLAKTYMAMGDAKKALEFAEEEVKLNPTLEFGYFVRAEANLKLKKWLDATKNYEKAISINGKYVEALLGLAAIKLRQNFNEESRELLLRAKKKEEGNPEIHKQLGYVYRASGQSGLAIESFETYLQIYPNAPDRGQIEGLIKQLK